MEGYSKRFFEKGILYIRLIDMSEVPIEFRKDINKYGLGKDRTIKAYHQFSGVDYNNKTNKNFCGKKYDIKKRENG